MDMKEEIMNDAIDDAMEDEGDEEERYFKYYYVLLCTYIFYVKICCVKNSLAGNYWSCQLPSLSEIDIL